MTPKQKEQFKVRAGIIRMAFWNGGERAYAMLQDWKLRELYELLEPEYQFMEEQQEIIVRAIEYVAEQLYDEINIIIERIKSMRQIPSATNDLICLIKLLVKMRKEFPAPEFKSICEQDQKWAEFFKEFPKIKKEYGLK